MLKVIRLFEDPTLNEEKEIIESLGLEIDFEVRICETEEDIIEKAQDADVIITVYEPLTKRVLSQLPNLKLVMFRSIGFNTIDLDYANEINLPVSNISKYCVDEVANYVIAAILMHNRRLNDFNYSVKVDKKWDYELFPNMRRLSAVTIGFIGFGNIPKLINERLKPFGCQVIAYDPYVKKEIFSEQKVKQVSLEEIFEQSDYISCHLPMNASTANSINESLFKLTKNSPVFINSSRGGVVDEIALANALENKQLSYAILDVLSSEDPDLSKVPFMEMDNVILTPHIAFYSKEAFIQGAQDNFRNLNAFINKDYCQAEIVNLSQIDL